MENARELRDFSVRQVVNAENKLSKHVDWDWSGAKHKG